MEFSSELLSALSKRAWRLSWILILYALISITIVLILVINKKLYILSNFSTVDENTISLIGFFADSFLVSLILFGIFYILKGDSDTSIKKSRERFYNKAIERVNLVFQYRYDFPQNDYISEIKTLTEYTKEYTKEDKSHFINIENLNTYIVDGIDSLYITYKLNEDEKILFSIWHSGTFIAIAIAIEARILDKSENEINLKFENTLNLAGSENEEKNRLSQRDGYWWFDIKYLTDEEFLFNNIEQEQITRKIAHIITVGLTASMELLEWKQKK
jgi:hypothetical protein